MKKNFFNYAVPVCCLLMIAVCFLPWVHYNSINETFTGFYVKRFATGVYYGRPGMFISVFAGAVFILTLWKNTAGRRINLFLAAILFAYCIRTYILFTGAIFEGEVEKLAGIYLILLSSGCLLVFSAFPRMHKG